MKRLILMAATVALLATSCEKTEIQNEVLTPISFSSNVGKQTKAIADGNGVSTYFQTQPFGVYCYGPDFTDANGTNPNNVMNNVEITYQTDKYVAKSGTKYYWPNDASTTLNFYAYSPFYTNDANVKNHKKLNGTNIAHSKTTGLNITGYVHKNMYVDYMLATAVTGAKYNDGTTNTNGVVDLKFNHQMTQIIFKVKTDATNATTYEGITFTLKKIQLNNIKNTGDITNGVFTNNTTGAATFEIFPAKLESNENGAPGLEENQTTLVIDKDFNDLTEIIPVTMIPQTFATGNNAQSVTIVYEISGTGVATETVTKTVNLPSTPIWTANKKISYSFTLGLKEIKFAPEVVGWDEDLDSNTTGIQNDPIVITLQ